MPTSNEAWLRRKVEVYCWTEQKTSFEERRGDQVRRGTKCDYTPTWCESVPNSKDFRDKSKVNQRSNISSAEWNAFGARLGAYEIGIDHVKQYARRVKYTKMYEMEMTQFIPPPDEQGVWTFDQREQVLRRQSRPGTNQIGDIKITYECLEGFGA